MAEAMKKSLNHPSEPIPGTLFSEHLKCSICLEMLRIPIMTAIGCGHRFCETDIKTVLIGDNRCPLCRAEIRELFRDNLVEQLLEDYYKLNPNVVPRERCKSWTGPCPFDRRKNERSEEDRRNSVLSSLMLSRHYIQQERQLIEHFMRPIQVERGSAMQEVDRINTGESGMANGQPFNASANNPSSNYNIHISVAESVRRARRMPPMAPPVLAQSSGVFNTIPSHTRVENPVNFAATFLETAHVHLTYPIQYQAWRVPSLTAPESPTVYRESTAESSSRLATITPDPSSFQAGNITPIPSVRRTGRVSKRHAYHGSS